MSKDTQECIGVTFYIVRRTVYTAMEPPGRPFVLINREIEEDRDGKNVRNIEGKKFALGSPNLEDKNQA